MANEPTNRPDVDASQISCMHGYQTIKFGLKEATKSHQKRKISTF